MWLVSALWYSGWCLCLWFLAFLVVWNLLRFVENPRRVHFLHANKESNGQLVQKLWFLFTFPWIFLFVWLERSFRIPVGFPRNTPELLKAPAQLFQAMADSAALRGASMKSVKMGKQHEAEPDKAATSGMFEVSYTRGSAENSLSVFVKFTGERDWPLFIKAISASFIPHHMELHFHKVLAPLLPVPSPKYLGSRVSRLFQKALVITQVVPSPYRTIPDHEGVQFVHLKEMLVSIARMHAAYWGKNALKPETAFLAQRGVKGIDLVNLDFLLSKPAEIFDPYFVPLWRHLQKYFSTATVCLLHGDFRPGNMLFLPCTAAVKSKVRSSPRLRKRSRASQEEEKEADLPDFAADEQGSWLEPAKGALHDVIVSTRGEDHPDGIGDAAPVAGARAPRVIFADWEAVCIMPFMWDFMYLTAIGQGVAERKARHKALLSLYREALMENGVPAEDVTEEICMDQYMLLCIVLLYYSIMLGAMGAVGETQGNSEEDGKAWNIRITDLLLELKPEKCGQLLGCDPQLIRDLQSAIIRDSQALAQEMVDQGTTVY